MPSTDSSLTTQLTGSSGSTAKPSDSMASLARPAKGGPRRFPSAVQTAHFKAFWVKPVGGKTSSADLVQTVIPKRLLKKAVDRNGLRRVLREAVRAMVKAAQQQVVREAERETQRETQQEAQRDLPGARPEARPAPTPRVVLTSARGFAEQASRHALKSAWRQELDQLMSLLAARLKY
jgi:RNase P protein component